MSAWVVTSGHIDVLINAAGSFDLLDGKDPRELGQMLWRENHRSVNARYRERTRTPHYALHTTEAPLHPVAVLKAIGCYEYQTCEHANWPRSHAFKFCEVLRGKILARHPYLAAEQSSPYGGTRAAYYAHPVYDAAPWGFESVDQAAELRFPIDLTPHPDRR